MIRLEDNFTILLRDRRGLVVPGSVRTGHNVMTNAGKDLLAQLCAWGTVDAVDVPVSDRRARYIGVGSGQLLEDPSVNRLDSPLTVNVGGDYLKALSPALTVFVTLTAVTLKASFSTSEITHTANAVIVSEAGLFLDVSPGGSLTISSPDNEPAFYKTFDPITKLNSFSMEVAWELRF